MAKIGYIRVSDNDQTEALQVDALEAAGCAKFYRDHGVSGASKDRKGLNEILEELQTGDILVVWKLDRLSRSLKDILFLFEKLESIGCGFISVTEAINTTTPAGVMQMQMVGSFAQFERCQISERTKAGMAAAKRRGQHVGRPRKLSPAQIQTADELTAQKKQSIKSMAEMFEVDPETLRRALKKYRAA